jgi:hypothetical protein
VEPPESRHPATTSRSGAGRARRTLIDAHASAREGSTRRTLTSTPEAIAHWRIGNDARVSSQARASPITAAFVAEGDCGEPVGGLVPSAAFAGERSSDCWTAMSTGQLVRVGHPERASRAALGVSSAAAPRSAQSVSGLSAANEVCSRRMGMVPSSCVASLHVIQRRVEPWSRPTAGTPGAPPAGAPDADLIAEETKRADLTQLRELDRRYAFAEPTLRRLDVRVLVARDELGRQVGAGSRQPPSACPTRGSPRARGRRLFGGAGAVGE